MRSVLSSELDRSTGRGVRSKTSAFDTAAHRGEADPHFSRSMGLDPPLEDWPIKTGYLAPVSL